MSESDDWENQLDSDNEEQEQKKKQEEEKAKQNKFEDEEKVSAEEVARKKKEEIKKLQEEQMENARTKESAKVDYDKKFEERQMAAAGFKPTEESKDAETKGMSKAAKGILMEQAQEAGIAAQLFGGEEEGAKVQLSNQSDYTKFAKNVGNALYEGNAPYHIDKFFKHLAINLPQHCDSKSIKSIADNLMVMYNNKVKEERESDKHVKKKKAVLKGGGGKGYDFNNNTAMVNDVMGDYGGYGEEDDAAAVPFKKEAEAEVDFM